jgi:hypothetical protein
VVSLLTFKALKIIGSGEGLGFLSKKHIQTFVPVNSKIFFSKMIAFFYIIKWQKIFPNFIGARKTK